MTTDMMAVFITPDIYTLLRLFSPWGGGNDRPMSWQALHQQYHSVYDNLERPKTQWSARRLEKALDAAESAELIKWQEQPWLEGWKWVITDKGIEARKAERERREVKHAP